MGRTCSLFGRGLLVGINWVYPSSGILFQQKVIAGNMAKAIAKLEHWWPRKERKEERRTKGPAKKNANCLQKVTVQSPWTRNDMKWIEMIWQVQEVSALQVEFSSSILPIASKHTTIFAWFTRGPMHSHMVIGYRFFSWGGGPIALHGLVHFLSTIGPSLT